MGRLREYNRGTLDEGGTGIIAPITLAGTKRMYSWELDSVGNWLATESTDTADVTTTQNRTHNKLHQIIDVDDNDSFDYDGNGNLVDDGTNSYTWDAMNRLLMVTSDATTLGEYRYDANGRRIRKTASETTIDYIYNGLRCLEERDSNDAMTKQFIWGLYVDELLQIKLADGSKYYPLQDLLYRTNVLTDASRNIVESYDCDAYGNTLIFDNSGNAKTSNIICEYIFTGRQLDSETGLYFYRARYYSPELGRFISKDPIGYIDGMGQYEYVGSEPINGFDPTGEWKKDDTDNNLYTAEKDGETLQQLSKKVSGKDYSWVCIWPIEDPTKW